MDQLHSLYYFLDLAGTFAFAISGATAAKQRGLDLFGIFAIAFLVACGGGIIRDLCIGAIPPAGLTNWQYLVTAIIATALTVGIYSLVQKLHRPVILFDALGLSLFAVTGAQKTLLFGHTAQVAVILGITTAVGGGVLRDIMLNRIPVILEREIYASAALIGAAIVVSGNYFNWISADLASILGLLVCVGLRMLALKYQWNMPATKPQNFRSEIKDE